MLPSESTPTSRGSLRLPPAVPYPPTDQISAPVTGLNFESRWLPVSATTSVSSNEEYSRPEGYVAAWPGPPNVASRAGGLPVAAEAGPGAVATSAPATTAHSRSTRPRGRRGGRDAGVTAGLRW